MAIRPLPVYETDQDFYEALLQREERAYQFLYSTVFPSFRHWVVTNNGSEMDAEDAFQKGLLNFLLNLETGKYQFQAGTRITTVAFEYCKRVWLTELRSARLRYQAPMPSQIDTVDSNGVEQDLERMTIVSTVQQSLHQLKDVCRNVIEWFYVEELSLREIAQRLGMKEESVKSKRYQCAERLKELYLQTARKQGL
ncbi:RNA polymerase sigma factor [Larkinella insperata]|uniref:RNA polymerase sigma factor n=1 Tax=Larkinella insperata TaxID=332158 RepID=A0ABW3QMA1_9BACT